MALPISAGSGATVATEVISGQHYGYNKITDATLGGSATVGMVVDSGANASGAAHVFLRGNATLSDSKGFIGLVTVVGNLGVAGNVTLSDPKGFIGLVTAVNGLAWPDPKTYIGLVTVGGIGTVTLADPKGFIGLVTTQAADPKGFIGLVTTVPTYISGYTSFATIVSAAGLATLVIAPAGQKTILRNIHVSSLGRAEVSVWGANTNASTARIPWTSLATSGGYAEHFGADGLQMGGADWGLNVALNGGTTIGIMVDVRFL